MTYGYTVDRELKILLSRSTAKIKHAKNKLRGDAQWNKLARKSTLPEVNVRSMTTASNPWFS